MGAQEDDGRVGEAGAPVAAAADPARAAQLLRARVERERQDREYAAAVMADTTAATAPVLEPDNNDAPEDEAADEDEVARAIALSLQQADSEDTTNSAGAGTVGGGVPATDPGGGESPHPSSQPPTEADGGASAEEMRRARLARFG